MPTKRKPLDLGLRLTLRPTKKLHSATQEALWRRLLDVDFRTSIGIPRMDHVSAGTIGESHVEYTTDNISMTLYDRGVINVEVEKFLPSQSRRVESMLKSVLRLVGHVSRRRVEMEVTGYIHTDLISSTGKFMLNNIRFSPTRKFRQVFGDAKITSFIVGISKTLRIVFIASGHIDFLYHDRISSAAKGKEPIQSLTRISLKYLNAIKRQI